MAAAGDREQTLPLMEARRFGVVYAKEQKTKDRSAALPCCGVRGRCRARRRSFSSRRTGRCRMLLRR